jgi:hypothetical protein
MELAHATNEERRSALRDVEDEIERVRAKIATMTRDKLRAALARLEVLESHALALQRVAPRRGRGDEKRMRGCRHG